NKIEGLVVVFLDIDQLRRTQQLAMDANRFASAVVDSVPVPVLVLDKELAIRTANSAFRDLSQLDPKELEGRSLPDLVYRLWGIDSMRERLQGLLNDPETNLEFEHESSTAQKKILLIHGRVLANEGDHVFLLMIEDVTLRREAERLESGQKKALETEVEEAASTLTRTKEQMRGLTGHLFQTQEEERQHIARELHDDVSQRLSFLEMLLSDASASSAEDECSKKLESARKELQSLNTDIRQISHRLHPRVLKDLGLAAALRGLVEEFDRREGMPASFSSRGLPEQVPDEAATAL